MINAEPDYKMLYQQSQKRLEEVEAKAQKQLLETILKAKELQEKALQELTQQYEQKLHLALLEANALRARLFGIKADSRVKRANEDQLEIFYLGASLEAIQASEVQAKTEAKEEAKKQEASAEKRKRAPRTASRMVLPENLEREEVIIDPEGDLTNYKVIGEEVTEVLVIVPASFKVKRIIRRKWALKDSGQLEKGVLVAPIPSRTVKRGLFDESVIAHLLVSKYIDHLPLYRQKKIFEREGMKIPPSTLVDNTAAGCQVLKPIYNALKREVLANLYLQGDETTIKVLQSEKKGACHLGYYWAYHAPADGLVFFDYQQGRGQEGPGRLLKDFKGVFQSDGYSVYRALFKNSKKVNQLYCMAHIRRKFDEAVCYDKERATYAVRQINLVYEIEREIREASPQLSETDIVKIRMEKVAPILRELKSWMLAEYPGVLPSSPVGKAIAYALPLWDNMHYYTLHGHLQIDNNAIENAIRPIALGRKNYLFAGTHESAQNAAMVYSLFATCKKHDVNPQEWLSNVLQKLNDTNYQGKFSDLLPHRWKNNQNVEGV
ncbi:MAG: IS66 family transposase [Bacteroidota bacterium]|jgi:transposase|nr:IS66 family transposase [Bacteroidota bacterium]